MQRKKIKAVALFSGGLDSMLSIKLVQEQGIEIIAIHFDIGFNNTEKKLEFLKKTSEQIGVKLEIINIKQDYIKKILFKPKYGWGKNLNPCFDCHLFMLSKANEYRKKISADFIITGEVLGQRPFSQSKKKFEFMESKLGIQGLVLRPLSAKLLKSTIIEESGVINTENLLNISGANRKKQLELIKKYNIMEYEAPSGGCLLTQNKFCDRICAYTGFEKESRKINNILYPEQINLFKLGRHFKIDEKTYLIISRNNDENNILQKNDFKFFEKIYINSNNIVGPISLVRKGLKKHNLKLIFGIILSYTKADLQKKYQLLYNKKVYKANPLKKEFSEKYLI